ncbi:MAG TPA: DivIVA domain-containing protein [Thermoanaerobaculia bacterium]|nr:DivIVA domain-containing protein [Thermoanaerobaculia bacterium]
MALTPLEIQKMRFSQKMRGFDPTEVEGFLSVVAEDLSNRVAQAEKLERENRYYKQRLEETEAREHQLQQTLLRAQKVSDDLMENARREAELMVKEAELMADRIVQQAIEQSARIDGKISELKTARRELQLKFKNTLDLFQRILEAEMEDDRNQATVLTLHRKRQQAGA